MGVPATCDSSNTCPRLRLSTINTTDCIFGTLNFHKIYGFHKSGSSGQCRGIQNSSCSWDNLTAATMDSISVKCNVIDVKSYSAHVFVTENTFFGGPLETSNNRVLDFIQVLNSLGGINNNVGSSSVGAETPNLPSFSDVVFVLISQVATTDLEILFGCDLTVVDVFGKAIGHRNSLHKKTVVLVG